MDSIRSCLQLQIFNQLAAAAPVFQHEDERLLVTLGPVSESSAGVNADVVAPSSLASFSFADLEGSIDP